MVCKNLNGEMIGELRKGIMVGKSLQLKLVHMLKPSLVVQLLTADNVPTFDILRYIIIVRIRVLVFKEWH